MVDGTSRSGTIGREGTRDRVEIGLRELGCPGAEEVEAEWVVPYGPVKVSVRFAVGGKSKTLYLNIVLHPFKG